MHRVLATQANPAASRTGIPAAARCAFASAIVKRP
jgi:hypothetical protein